MDYRIEETKSTPEIIFEKDVGKLTIKGQSYPEDAVNFYSPILTVLQDYFKSSNTDFELNVRFVYLNTSSLKCMMILFDILNGYFKENKKITINWYYKKDDEILKECGEDLKEDVEAPFNIIMDN